MQPKYALSASVICSDFYNLGKDLKLLKKGEVDYLHIDIMDGLFVPRLGLFPEIIKTIKKNTTIPMDVHLMVSNPEEYVPLIADSGASIIVIHVETCVHLHRTIQLIKKYSAKVGVALNPATPLTALEYIIDDLDMVVVMGINPGILGQNLIPTTYRKLQNLKSLFNLPKNLLIEVDGGVNYDTASKLIQNGANVLVCGSSTIFNHPHPLDVQLSILHQRINKDLQLCL